MEDNTSLDSTEQDSPEQLPPFFKYIESNPVAGFDTIPDPHARHTFKNGPEVTNSNTHSSDISMLSSSIPVETIESTLRSSISISMPASPSNLYVDQTKCALVNENPVSNSIIRHSDHSLSNNASGAPAQQKQSLFYSQPIQASQTTRTPPQSILGNNRLKDKRFDSFKTWSGRLERQISNLRGIPQDPEDISNSENTEYEAIPAVQRYFDALEGPELETLKSSEELILPKDKKWPFLLRFPISAFGMCLGVSSQAILWKTLATSPSMSFLHVSLIVNLILWCISLVLMGVVACTYSLKIIFYFEAVRREYYHPVRVNFFFAPWIACLFLALGVPPSVAVNLHASLWYVLMIPILCLELKIYGQWMSGGQRRLSKVANPTNHLSVVGNFVGALLGASMGLKEGPIFFFAVGLAHYSVLFVTLYQRLPTNETLPKELHPVFFLFVAAPSVASMAWAKISGDFSYGSRIVYFIALFLYISLVVRINFFRGFRFSLAWWAYTFPMTGASIATIRYSAVVRNWLTESLSVALSAIATVTVCYLLLSTVLHAFVFHDLFPNDISIAISEKRTKPSKKHSHRRTTSSDDKDVEACLSV